MKTIGLAAIVAIAALVLGFGARLSAPTAHADATGNVVIPCEFLASAIDGNLDDVTDLTTPVTGDLAVACDGISATEVGLLALALGDGAAPLTKSDFADIDLDGNQVADGGAGHSDDTYIFEFVNDEGNVTFDAPTGLTVSDGATDGTAFATAELCALVAEDLDCNTTITGDGDGVVVARVNADAGTAGDTPTVTVTQESVADTADIVVTGIPHEVSLATPKATIETSGVSTAFTTCKTDSDVSDAGQLGDANRTFVVATVLDSDGTKLTRAIVTYSSDAISKANLDSDASPEVASDPKSHTGESVDAGTAGTASFAVICGGTATGTAKIKATLLSAALASVDTATVELTVTGVPASIALTASPAQIACDGTQTSSVTAKVTDSAGNNVADGNTVKFEVVALGTANPINVKTAGGSASSTITPLSGSTAGVTVVVTSGDAQASIRVDCSLPIPPTAVPPGAVPTAKVGGTIGGPDTGNGGYLGQDGSAGIPTWTLVALALGSVALVAGGMVTRRAGK